MQCRHPWFLAALVAAMTFVAAPTLARDYVITSGDVLNIKVAGEADLSKPYNVSDEGTIFVPFLQKITANGKTEAELQEELTTKLKTYIKDPVVTVEVTNPNNTVVWITGEVNTPGEVKVKPDARLLEVLQKAGIKDTAKKTEVTLLRKAESRVIDLDAVMKGDMTNNILLEVGDRIHIPKEVDGKIKILGEVGTPGEKPLGRNMTPMEAISAAGGFKDTADKSEVELMHKDGTVVKLDMETASRGGDSTLIDNLFLQPDDVIRVPNNKNNQVIVTGSGVKTPGNFTWESNMTVWDAITKAGGFAERAQKDKVRMVPKGGGTPSQLDFEKYLTLGDSSQNMQVAKGATIYVEQDPPKEPKQPKKNFLETLMQFTPLYWILRYD